ncbi:DUF1428 domain-containing protein [Tabrizicola soli]|uniref:DUF1428 domain-containing protein n=1 Tax=Tabrizicola soli TaxID=2185115 RepID=A0ABV7DS58_9RHOB|nr:DUF1428 domain-containing protein [Tabrizicola soli]
MYMDGFLIPVRDADKEAYRAHEAKWWPTFRDMGARALVVGWGDDVPQGKQTDFRRAVDLQEGETVVLCWMTWPDKATRDAAYARMMAEMPQDMEMPFDGKRMVYGGFSPILELS